MQPTFKEQIHIPVSKRKLAIAVLGSFVFVALGLVFIFGNLKTPSTPSYTVLIGILAVFVFGIFAILGIKSLLTKAGDLIINNKGIILPKVALIEWADITGFRVIKIQGTKLILIDLIDAEKYLNKLNKLAQFCAAKSLQLYGAAFSISSNSLKCKFSYLEQALQDKLREYRQSP
ncbi:STM3941 family protein [Orbus sturtevantii]|uniref:STM3941 family protein n=1 Tax=Orbus sturtevantii TaxID=3074109 RepID=UPI00370D3370